MRSLYLRNLSPNITLLPLQTLTICLKNQEVLIMDFKPYVQILWTVLLSLFMIFLDADSADLKTLARNSDISVYICMAIFVFYLICQLLGFEVICLLISGIILMTFIFAALVHEGGYFYIFYICIFCTGLLSRERHVVLFTKFIVILVNFALLLDIVIVTTEKSKI